MRNSYDLCKILRISPTEIDNMSVAKIRFYLEQVSIDLKNKDPWIVPQKLSL